MVELYTFMLYFCSNGKNFPRDKNSEERLQTCIEDLEGRFGQCHGSTTRRKISPPEVRVSYFDLLR